MPTAVGYTRQRMSSQELASRRLFLLLFAAALTIVMTVVLWPFLLTIVSSVVLAGLLRPVYRRIHRRVRRPAAAAGLTVLATMFVVVVPLIGLGGLVVAQATAIVANVRPIVEQAVQSPTYLDEQLQRLPGYERFLAPYRAEILTKAGEAVSATGAFLVSSLSSTTVSTVSFLGNFFLALYATFFLLKDAGSVLAVVLDFLPIHRDDARQIADRFLSIVRATVKGTLVIGAIQGILNGFAFWVVGIPAVAFWTVVMILLSVLPMVGGALIWVPACLVLVAKGALGKALFVALFCALISGSVDNVLRPRLVGRDTKLHELVVLFSTLGGLLVIGPFGFVLGPVMAGLFVTVWHLFGAASRDDEPA